MDRQAGIGWDQLVLQAAAAADRAWAAMTSDPRRVDERQHRLRGSLGSVTVHGVSLEQWQHEVTGSGRVWYAIDDVRRTLWLTQAIPGHPKSTDTRHRRRR
ncbi:MAG: hypothetical protein ACREQM_02010 [Candidatus Dormibacteraceae bacterium]